MLEREMPTPNQSKEVQEAFIDIYGISIADAVKLSHYDGEIGKHWTLVFQYLHSPITQTEPCEPTTLLPDQLKPDIS